MEQILINKVHFELAANSSDSATWPRRRTKADNCVCVCMFGRPTGFVRIVSISYAKHILLLGSLCSLLFFSPYSRIFSTPFELEWNEYSNYSRDYVFFHSPAVASLLLGIPVFLPHPHPMDDRIN